MTINGHLGTGNAIDAGPEAVYHDQCLPLGADRSPFGAPSLAVSVTWVTKSIAFRRRLPATSPEV
ncbi:hypothetical protein [Micromonospora polyrhachis]|uniref:Uncharacterized protein n=1 Tax=Micromonospora polyrhachis TaxID=1282883 RepID=A0A7W7SU62_9ACTN|nr:hypothetical protein [Micromonospora polyrhachis]MBB4960953.1 hypothetical protein [Micromonospora polyrhachis]